MTNREIVDAALSVASITRCKDCRHFAEWVAASDEYGDCMRNRQSIGLIVNKMHFCGGGERYEQDSD